MDDITFEKYCFLRLYAIDLDTALQAIKVLRRYRRIDVKCSLIRDVAVTYARPFSVNKGNHIHKHQLSERNYVNQGLRSLHTELVRLRNEQFAHTDLQFYRPRVAKFKGATKHFFPMSFKSYDYGVLLGRIAEIEKLVREVEGKIQATLDRYEKDL